MSDKTNNTGPEPLKDGAGEPVQNTPAQPDAYRENEKIYTQNQGGGLYGVVGAAGDEEDPQPELKKEDEEEPDYRIERDDFDNYKDSERGSTDEHRKRDY